MSEAAWHTGLTGAANVNVQVIGQVLKDPSRREGEAVTHRVCCGTFRASDGGLVKVWIIARGYDADHRLAEACGLAAGRVTLRATPLSLDGVLYYEEGETTPYRTVAEAKRAADRRAYGPLHWQTVVGDALPGRWNSALMDRLKRFAASFATWALVRPSGARPAASKP